MRKKASITLPWVNLLRKRLEEKSPQRFWILPKKIPKWKDLDNVKEFIQPILDYGKVEEIRITKSFHKDIYNNCKCKVCKN